VIYVLAVLVTCSAFAIAVSFSSIVIGAAAPAVARRLDRRAPARRASALFWLRMLPSVSAIVFAIAVALPTFVWFEPRDTQESITLTLAAMAAFGMLVLGRGAREAIAAWWATRRVLRRWRQHGRAVESLDAPVPVLGIEEPFPTVAVVGVAHPALFISERVLRECSEEEVRAMVAHECSHIARRDNLRRWLIRGCPDFRHALGSIERAWSAAAEEAADAAARQGRPDSALDLAQALIHIARLAPDPHAPALASAFYLGGSIESRIRRLVEPGRVPDPSRPLGCVAIASIACIFAAAAFATAPALHQLIEAAVHFLP
jgi:hypothetical protein